MDRGILWDAFAVGIFLMFLGTIYARHRVIEDMKSRDAWNEERLLAMRELEGMGMPDPIDATTRTVRASYDNLSYNAKAVGRPQPWENQ